MFNFCFSSKHCLRQALAVSFIFFSIAAAAKNVKPFVYCSEGSPSNFNPQIASDGTTFDATKDIYDSLLEFKRGSSDIRPALARSWKVSKDGLQYTFQLRKDVSFHETSYFKPTRMMNADDVVFSFKRALDKKHPYHSLSGVNYQYFSAMGLTELVKDIVKEDKWTVRFDLNKKSSIFLISLAMQFTAVLSKEYADYLMNKKTPARIDYEPIGTGPFIFSSYEKDSLIRYKANDKYFKKPPALKRVIFSITPDPSTRFQKLKRGECHLISFPSPTHYKAIEKHKKLKLIQAEVYNMAYLGMNVEKKPLDDVKVRKAVRYALNRPLYIKAIYLGRAKTLKNPIPPAMWSYNNNTPDYEYNIKKAKQLLKSAGYEKGFEIDLWTLPVSRPYNPAGKKMGELMQADLARVGIKVQLKTYDWTTYLNKVENGEHALAQLGWTSDNGDPDNFLGTLLGCSAIKSGTNISRWCHTPYDKLIKEAAETLDKTKRAKLYQRAQVIFSEQSPFAPLVHTYGYRGASRAVRGYILAPFGAESFYGVSLRE